MLGLRFLQASLLVPLHRGGAVSARAPPIRFEEVSRLKRPDKKATPELKRAYQQAHKQLNRSRAYLLCSDLVSSSKQLLQIDFDRWQTEVNHRDEEVNHRQEKDSLGVGQAQLWNRTAVPKQPVLALAAYSALLPASLIAFGPQRGPAYAALPKWRRKAKRPSCLDLITLLRQEIAQPPSLEEFEIRIDRNSLVLAAA